MLIFILIYLFFLQGITTIYAASIDPYENYLGYETHKLQDDSGCDIDQYDTYKKVSMPNGTVLEIRPLTQYEKTLSIHSPYWAENQSVTDKEVITITKYYPDLIVISEPDGNLTAENAHYNQKQTIVTDINTHIKELLVKEEDILSNLKVPTKVIFYDEVILSQKVLDSIMNENAANIANILVSDIINAQENNPTMELKFLIYDCIKQHHTKSSWALDAIEKIQTNSLAGKIVGYNYSFIHDVNIELSVNDKIIRAHINVQIALTNIAAERHLNLIDLIHKEDLYDHLFQKQFQSL